MNRLSVLLLVLALAGCSRPAASVPKIVPPPVPQPDVSLFSGETPKPGLTIRLDPCNTLAFVLEANAPRTLRWVITSTFHSEPGTGSVSSVSQEAGDIGEPSIYEWDPKTRTFWFGRKTLVQREHLVPTGQPKDGIKSSDGTMWAVPSADCLNTVKDAPAEFIDRMKVLMGSASKL